MYYYHLHLALYTLYPVNLPSTVFDKLPAYLVPKGSIDLLDKYYQQQQLSSSTVKEGTDKNISTNQHEQLYINKKQTDKALKPNVPPTPAYEYQKNTTTPSSTTEIPDNNNNNNNNSLHKSNTILSDDNSINPSFAYDDFRLGSIEIESIQKGNKIVPKKSKNNKNKNHGTSSSSSSVSILNHQSKIGYGILHLYRDQKPIHEDLMPDMLAAMNNHGELGKITCTLSVPSYMTTNDFLNFVKPFDDTVQQYIFIRDITPNKYMVIMKFKDVESAYTYHRKFNGRKFHGMEPEICHIVFIDSITWDINLIKKRKVNDDVDDDQIESNQKMEIQYPMLKDTLQAEHNKTAFKSCTIELPTCPVCLERMDENITGLLGITCQHSFDCGCLEKWGKGKCYVCRFSEKPVLEGTGRDITLNNSNDGKNKDGPKRNHQGWLLSRHTNDDRLCCFVCGATDSLWICMICGHIGCGRYQDAHAYRHYEETNHLFALEIDTQRVWDYVGDGYVHRLIQNAVDGNGNNRNHNYNDDENIYSPSKSEFPMIESSSTNNRKSNGFTNSNNRINNNTVWGEISSSSSIRSPKTVSSPSSSSIDHHHHHYHPRDNDIDTMQQEKINAMSIEYTALLTSQLESQRIYYEDQLNVLVKQLSNLSAKQTYLQNCIQEEMDHQQVLVSETKELTKEWKLAQEEKNKLDQKCQSWKDKYDSAHLLLEKEKQKTNKLSIENEEIQEQYQKKKNMLLELHEEIRDLTFYVETRNNIHLHPELVGGNVGTIPKTTPTRSNKGKRGKKGKR
ncbi:unnamed protein product [Cunninghamella blakesleeana]